MPASTPALRHLIASHRPRRARDGYPDHVRHEVVRHVSRLRRAGRPLTALSRDLGLPAPTLRRWLVGDEDRDGFVPVVLSDSEHPCEQTGPTVLDAEPMDSGRHLSLVTPGGYRVLGLDIDALRQLLTVLP